MESNFESSNNSEDLTINTQTTQISKDDIHTEIQLEESKIKNINKINLLFK